MEKSTRFYYGGITVNEHLILDALKEHGECVLHDTESPLARRFRRDWDGRCKYGDILAVFKKNGVEYLIGIEVKDWKARVTPKMCYQYLKTYRKGCQYVYIAARRFSPRTFDIHELGFIDLEKMEVIKRPEYLYPKKRDRLGVIRGMRGSPKPRRYFVMHPDQTTMEWFCQPPSGDCELPGEVQQVAGEVPGHNPAADHRPGSESSLMPV